MELKWEEMPAGLESVIVFFVALEERPFVVADDVRHARAIKHHARWGSTGRAGQMILQQLNTGAGTYGSLAVGGNLALPLNCSVISLKEVDSAR